MPVTKQTYTASSTWTASNVASIFRSAFIDAGLMTEWFDSTSYSGIEVRVIRLQYNPALAYGSTFYVFYFDTSYTAVSISSGWNTTTKTQAGTQYLDFHLPAASSSMFNNNNHGTRIFDSGVSTSSAVFLHRYTSGVDPKQSWFVFQQGLIKSRAFTLLHPSSVLHAWLDLDKGIVDPYLTAVGAVNVTAGAIMFREVENIRRCLRKGHALNGTATTSGNGNYHGLAIQAYSYSGLGSLSNNSASNFSGLFSNLNGSLLLPVAKAVSNPAFSADYIPICTGVPWSAYTPALLASDFGVYMHYANNTLAFQDRFIVTAGSEEWEIVEVANNSTVIDGVSPAFLARVI